MLKSILIAVLAFGLGGFSNPERLVNDFGNVFTEYQRDSLERVLVNFDEATSNQICVVTISDLKGADVDSYAREIANKWGVGGNKNNGVLILLQPRGAQDYVDISIQVGRGLEGAIPDAYASRIIRNIMGPYLRQDNYIKAISLGTAELMALAAGEISEPRDNGDDEDVPMVILLFAFIFAVVFIVLFISGKNSGDNGDNSGNSGTGGGPRVIVFPAGGRGGFNTGNPGSPGGFRGFGGGSFGGGGAHGRF